ncbi:MAG: hypothetical protein QM757_26240 [Paludibaculum sp.]
MTPDTLSSKTLLWQISLLDWFAPGATQASAFLPPLNDALKAASIQIYAVLGFDGSLTYYFEPVSNFGLDAKGSAGLMAAYEPKLFGMVEVKAYGKGQFELNVSRKPEIPWNATGDFALYGGFSISALGWGAAAEYLFWKGQIFETADSGSGTGASGEPLRWQLTDRSYQAAGPPVFTAATHPNMPAFRKGVTPRQAGERQSVRSEVTLVEGAYPTGTPSLASHKSEILVLSVADNGSSDLTQRTDINWTRFDGTSWSADTPILKDDTADFSPKVAYDGRGQAVAIWLRARSSDTPADDPDALSTRLEVVSARFGRESLAWSQVHWLTEDGMFDTAPQLTGPFEDGSLPPLWRKSDSLSASQRSTFFYSRWDPERRQWSVPQTVFGAWACRH